MDREETLDDILDTAFGYRGLGHYYSIRPSQIREEIRSLSEFVADYDPDTVIEIGTSKGGTLYIWCRHLNPRRVVSIDLPLPGMTGGGYPGEKQELFREFADDTTLDLIRADSHDPDTLSEVKERLGSDEIDFLFIDGDHSYEGVKQDFEMYRPLVSSGGLIAFHDIAEHPQHPNSEADRLWNEIKDEYETKEFIKSDEQSWAGLGVLIKP